MTTDYYMGSKKTKVLFIVFICFLFAMAIWAFVKLNREYFKPQPVTRITTTFFDAAAMNGYKAEIARLKARPAQIETKYIPYLQTVYKTTRPDTLIKWLVKVDSTQNQDSAVAIEILNGRKCCELSAVKDNIIYTDSVVVGTLETAVNDCTEAYSKEEKKVKRWQKAVLIGTIIFGIITILK